MAALKRGQIDEAIVYFEKSIELTELTLQEVDHDDCYIPIIQVQLSTLQQKLVRVTLLKHFNLTTTPMPKATTKAISLSPECVRARRKTEPSVSKCPKNEAMVTEETELCISELRRSVDFLAMEREELLRQVAEERIRRLTAEAELLATRVSKFSPQYTSEEEEEEEGGASSDEKPVKLTHLPHPKRSMHLARCVHVTQTPNANSSGYPDIWYDAST